MMSSDVRRCSAQVLETISTYRMIEPGDLVVVGVSGGIDSVVLLHILQRLQSRLAIRLHVAHLNHQFRGEEAERDADFVRQLAERLGLPCTIESRNVPEVIRQTKLSPQDAARQVRYEYFDTLARQLQAHKIATAHNADDQAETVLIGLIRGVGLHGLGGIRSVLRGKIIRPLLSTPRAAIEAFARSEDLKNIFDSSNASRKYLRNAVRLDLLPQLVRQFNPAMIARLGAYALLFQEDAFFIDKIAEEYYKILCRQVEQGSKIRLEHFAQQDVTIQRALIYKMYAALRGTRHELETRHVRAVIELFTEKPAGKRICLPGRISAIRTTDWGWLSAEAAAVVPRAIVSQELSIPGRTETDGLIIEAFCEKTLHPQKFMNTSSPGDDTLVQHFDYEHVCSPVVVRSRQPGDVFSPLGLHGSKRLKKFFIDRKVLRDKRDTIPLFVDTEGIFWVIGYSIAERVKVTVQTRHILTFRVHKTTSL